MAELRTVAPDGLEIYNLHANIDPNIRRDFLGLPEAGAIQAVVNFADTNPGGPEPDLALLGFLAQNQSAIDRWNTLLGEGMRITGTAGTDAHQNALPIMLADGERGDSYRRMIRWFANIALVADPRDPVMIEEAVRAGRLFVAFELLGTPVGFDARAVAPAGTVELGGQLRATDGAVFTVDLPTVRALDPMLPTPAIAGRLLRIDAAGVHELATGSDGTLAAPMDLPGAYRVEVTMIPRHLGPYLGDLGTEFADGSLPWIYSSPIYVE
ncbi:MAG: hypothetical protein H0T79_18795 [Deltaproteobacteria bacterium]|nr:hypothetical protein [Deltaproteobacteria bacterium]